MGALGDALELIATSHTRWRTLRMAFAEHHDSALGQIAIERAQPRFVLRRVDPPGIRATAHPTTGRSTSVLWARGLDRVRVESVRFSNDDPTGEPSTLDVRNGEQSWHRDSTGAIRVTNHNHVFGRLPSGSTGHLDARQMIQGGEVSVLGPGRVAGRSTLRIRILPADRSAGPQPGLGFVFTGWMGDLTEADLDAETGLALRIESFVDGQPWRTMEVTEITLDPELDESLFTEQPPPGAPTEDTHQMSRPIAEIAADVPFALFAPAGKRTDAMVSKGSASQPMTVRAFVIPEMNVRGRVGPVMPMQLAECDNESGVPDPSEWEVIHLASGTARLWQAPDDGEVHLLLLRQRTHVWIRGSASRDETVALAESLEPVIQNGPP